MATMPTTPKPTSSGMAKRSREAGRRIARWAPSLVTRGSKKPTDDQSTHPRLTPSSTLTTRKDRPCSVCWTILSDSGFPVLSESLYSLVRYDDLQRSGLMADGCRCCATILDAVNAWVREPSGEETQLLLKASAYGDKRFRVELHVRGENTPQLEIFWDEGTTLQLNVFGNGTRLSNHLALQHSIHTATRWLNDCRTHHQLCNADNTPSYSPTRLLRLFGSIEEPQIHLVVPNKNCTEYMTLSYCWGTTSNRVMTTTANVHERMAGVPWDSLHPIFQDAVQVTMGLGQQYLWIDSLCIVQDDPLDWEVESSQMANIYAHSLLTIYAASASSVDSSIFGPRSVLNPDFEREMQQDTAQVYYQHPAGHCIPVYVRQVLHESHGLGGDLALHRSPLDKRAWAFQEKAISTRTLEFREAEMMWECNGAIDCECGQRKNLDDLSRRGVQGCYEKVGFGNEQLFRSVSSHDEHRALFSKFWAALTEEYSRKNLTFPEDVFPALLGIVTRMNGLGLGRFLAGMWEQHLPACLCWEVDHRELETTASYAQQRDERVRTKYLAPSWSWASVRSPITQWKSGLEDFFCRVVRTECTPQGSDPNGRLKAGSLWIEGKVLRLNFVPQRAESTDDVVDACFDERRVGARAYLYHDYSPQGTATFGLGAGSMDFFKGEFPPDEEFYFLLVGHDDLAHYSLLLKRSALHSGSYERLGLASGFWSDDLKFTIQRLLGQAETRAIRIV